MPMDAVSYVDLDPLLRQDPLRVLHTESHGTSTRTHRPRCARSATRAPASTLVIA